MRAVVLNALGGKIGVPVCERLAADLAKVGPVDVLDATTLDVSALEQAIDRGDIDTVVLSGSQRGVYEDETWIHQLHGLVRGLVNRRRVPNYLGVCFGHQLLAHAFGGAVQARPPVRRRVETVVVLDDNDPVLGGLGLTFTAVVAHQDHVVGPPEGFRALATCNYTEVQALRHVEHPFWGVQFHPDIDREIIDGDVADRGPERWAELCRLALAGCAGPGVLPRFAAWVAARRAACDDAACPRTTARFSPEMMATNPELSRVVMS